ncbi:SDR family oxidoreductase [candidate division KSB1 bacterium]|nr:SDR family oxidoreductase [candidate division KSB1 bacterium]
MNSSNKKKRIGITGQAGFMGTHLFNYFGLQKDLVRIPFDDSYFKEQSLLEQFVKQCEVIVHLAAMNRHGDPQVIYDTNIRLVRQLVEAMQKTGSRPHVIMASSTQEERGNHYGRSKKEGREMLAKWAKENETIFTGLVIPNVYGPFGMPFYNSVISTFSYQLTHNERPHIETDASLKLIYVNELVEIIYKTIIENINETEYLVKHSDEANVSELLQILQAYQEIYLHSKTFPELRTNFQVNLFNTFRSYIETDFFPVNLLKNSDARGTFVETVKASCGGQFSFSTTTAGVTRGNHFHIRKVERFTVIQGEAIICLCKIGTNDIIEYKLNGDQPGFVDMPVWYTHNITNIGNKDLYTLFWINEFFDPNDPDTYFEKV